MYARVSLKGRGRMKHQKEWYTCDRCGAEIDFFERSIISRKVYRIGGLFFGKDIDEYKSIDGFELCPKCRKDFERFMRNEEIKK